MTICGSFTRKQMNTLLICRVICDQFGGGTSTGNFAANIYAFILHIWSEKLIEKTYFTWFFLNELMQSGMCKSGFESNHIKVYVIQYNALKYNALSQYWWYMAKWVQPYPSTGRTFAQSIHHCHSNGNTLLTGYSLIQVLVVPGPVDPSLSQYWQHSTSPTGHTLFLVLDFCAKRERFKWGRITKLEKQIF